MIAMIFSELLLHVVVVILEQFWVEWKWKLITVLVFGDYVFW